MVGIPHGVGRQGGTDVRRHAVSGVPRVQIRFQDQHVLTRDLTTAEAPDQLLGLARVHAACDDLNHVGTFDARK